MVYGIIIAAVVPGYIFGARLIRTENKSVSHSWFAWLVTLACYPPFEYAFFVSWFDYNPNTPNPVWLQPWAKHLQHVPAVLAIVGGVILIFSLVHLWGEAQFGLRSSNMTNRGIITTGPYRFCKHPVYLAKCIVWLLVWLPFASGMNAFDDLRLTMLWMCVCGIFILRAVAEETLLSRDPDYVAYARWVEEHGALGFLRKIPAFSYEWRLARWQRQGLDF
jgi:protein-S-isoprenylcysteine O-methyltransferase Ste14